MSFSDSILNYELAKKKPKQLIYQYVVHGHFHIVILKEYAIYLDFN